MPSGLYVPAYVGLTRNKKTVRLAALLGINRHETAGHLLDLWGWGLTNADTNGVIGDLSADEVALAFDWQGDPQTLLDALINAVYLERTRRGLMFHDWPSYGGRVKREREHNAKRQKRFRSKSRNGYEGVTVTEEKPLRNPGDETRRDETKELQKRKARGARPPASVAEVAAYCREHRYSFSPERFVAFYDSNGWRVGKNPMKDWHAACRSWQERQQQDEPHRLPFAEALRDDS